MTGTKQVFYLKISSRAPILLKMFSLKQKIIQIHLVTIEKSNFFSSRKCLILQTVKFVKIINTWLIILTNFTV